MDSDNTYVSAYCRVSTEEQNIDNQELQLRQWCDKQGLSVDRWYRVQMSSKASTIKRSIEEMKENSPKGSTVVAVELSRLGRSVAEILNTINTLKEKKVRVVTLRENIDTGKDNITTKVMINMFGLLSEIERDLIVERTKAGLARAKASGKRLGRKKGQLAKSKLDDHREEIVDMLERGIRKAVVSKMAGCTVQNLYSWLKTRKIEITPKVVEGSLLKKEGGQS